MRFIFSLLILITFVKANMSSDIEIYYKEWKQLYLVKEDNLYRVATDKDDKSRTVSEGQGYGMLFAVLLEDNHDIFDALWRYSRVHKSSISKDLMSWQIPEKEAENDSAFDGDADIAYALILADKKWGSKGFISYKKEAKKVLDAIWKYTIGEKIFLPLLGDWVEQDGKKYNQYTVRTSDFMIGHFKEFYCFTEDKKWLNVVKAMQKALLDVQDTKTGLVPDFIRYDKNKKRYLSVEDGFLETHDSAYYYNACRVPFRVGIDAVNGDEISKNIVKKLSLWSKKIAGGDPLKFKSGFELNGTIIGDYFSIVFLAPFGVASMSDDTIWSKKIFDVIKSRHENYYEDSVALLSMLAMNGKFKILR